MIGAINSGVSGLVSHGGSLSSSKYAKIGYGSALKALEFKFDEPKRT